jgi:glucokinase
MAERRASHLVLGADVGGTKTWLRLAQVSTEGAQLIAEQRFESGAGKSLTPMLQAFLQNHPAPSAACIAVACPVETRRVRLTNLDLTVDADEIERTLGVGSVRLINDFVAVGYGIETLSAKDVFTLQAGPSRRGAPRVVLGAGTGLGEALLVWQGDHYEVVASEGGHVDFAPTDEEQVGLWRFLARQYGHVSYERLLSGNGLVAIAEFLMREHPATPDLEAAMRGGDAAAAVSAAALAGTDPLAARALDLFLRIYGAQAGNLALTAWAQGGVYVAGGIVARILPKVGNGQLLEGFRDKGRYRDALAAMPLHVVTNPQVGLAGSVAAAARLASSH